MADKAVGELPQASVINDNDLFLLEQGGTAKNLLGSLLKDYIDRASIAELASQILEDPDVLSTITAAVVNYDILGRTYPVGSIYISVNSTSPATLFGGTWERIQGKFLLASSTSYAAGTTGGSASHTLTVNEMPNHSHEISGVQSWPTEENATEHVSESWGTEKFGKVSIVPNTRSSGGGNAFSIMPPYLSVYVWKRTA